jgi:hypothetical protein
MPAPFKQITREQFAELLSHFPFTRKINAVHMHHTWRPNHAQYRGHDTIVAMWRFHTEENHWSDIAQHITIAPDGTIWLGRDWNRPPASASGHNGTAQAGPFMFEMIGDFDQGKDRFELEQRRTALEVIARVQLRFGLPPGTLVFHNMMSSKSCPGTSIDFREVLGEVTDLHAALEAGSRAAPSAQVPFPPEKVAPSQGVVDAIEDLQRDTGRAVEPPDAEPCNHERAREGEYEAGFDARASGPGIRFDGADLQALRPHIVNLRMGQFSSDGDWTTSPEDVDAIFDGGLAKALEKARKDGRKLKVMFYAHGGLNSEASSLAKARERIGWWLSNGIYPIYFIWETSLCEVLGQMLQRWSQGRGAAARNLFSDHVSDPRIEAFVHEFGGRQVWGAMKWSAQQAAAPDAGGSTPGGAYYVARKLAKFCEDNGDAVELHAVGHSAGAIFHAHFLPCALELGVPRFHSLHLMAPAVRVDLFRQQLQARIGEEIATLTMYTMEDSFEKDDNCAGVYRKSLLYLISKGLEPEMDVPILGLERCVRADPHLKQLFGIGAGEEGARVVWSDNRLDSGRSASRSRTHGGFDDDRATMGSIVRRILDKADADRIVEFPETAARTVDPWRSSVDWSAFWSDDGAGPGPAMTPPQPAAGMQPTAGWAASAPARPHSAQGGKRIALCVGIDSYPTAPLGGCVNDARAWADALVRLGFDQPRMILNDEATRDAIVGTVTTLVGKSGPGDVIVFQYAGHGTQVPDLSRDEQGGDTPGEDEALCPFDFASGELLIDDDMREIFRALPDGVNLTCFFDCCHSGTITRMALGGRPGVYAAGKHARFIRADNRLIEKFAAKRASGRSRALPGGGIEVMREVVFSACLSSEVALESDGHGDFTRRAMQVLARGVEGLSNGQFADRVTQAFGHAPQQHAKLYASDTGSGLGLLQPLGAASRGRAAREGMGSTPEHSELVALLSRASYLLTRRD